MMDNLILTGTAYIDREEPPAPKKEALKEPPKIQENKEKENTGSNNITPKNVSNKEVLKTKKEKVTVTLPAIPFKIIKQ